MFARGSTYAPKKMFTEIIINSKHLVICRDSISKTAQQKTPADGTKLPLEMIEHSFCQFLTKLNNLY